MPFEPVQRPAGLSDLAYEQLRSRILDGDFPEGRRMSVVSIAEQLNMSRSPVRAAVERLVTEGLLVVTAVGIELAQLDHADLIEGLQVRSRLEGLATRLATDRLMADDFTSLRKNLTLFDAAVRSSDTVTARRLDLEFHSVIRDKCGNRLLVENLRRVQARVIVATYMTAWVPAHEAVIDEHAAILKALEKRDADAAEHAAIEHLERLITRVTHYFSTAEATDSADTGVPTSL
ncbi:GntR family transcriptional regulator [Mycolicibacterium agri]|uniref:Transcriptional regulator n=1 Tax=Mycolicibacterium agri TaxID=36811 RepID=A0A2A7N067_MYCAG|nr:GntR family transcriptional regulator [Mycolicibacterium agri]PEG37209.1 GntR family transcriptional regulator [Mycolicibacterium agri]GFG54995.1 transcriptional regulator [Mycolicibacterium agri]